MNKIEHRSSDKKRQMRVRGRISGTTQRPRLSVCRTQRYVYLQVIDDSQGKTVAAMNESMLKKAGGKLSGTKTDRAKQLTAALVEQLKKQKISQLAFDRGSFRYHGRVRAIAEALREHGLEV